MNFLLLSNNLIWIIFAANPKIYKKASANNCRRKIKNQIELHFGSHQNIYFVVEPKPPSRTPSASSENVIPKAVNMP